MPAPLNEEQEAALVKILYWLRETSNSYFVLGGHAGTGKTFTCQALLDSMKLSVCFTAPTNKAVKVLRQTMHGSSEVCSFATTYAILGLRLHNLTEVKKIGRGKSRLRAQDFDLVVVDEASMVSAVLMQHIEETAHEHPRTRFLFMGDSAQLPPVGERRSRVWRMVADKVCDYAVLTRVMRHDNKILEQCTILHRVIKSRKLDELVTIEGHDATTGGVYKLDYAGFLNAVQQHAALSRQHGGGFVTGSSKVIAWTNRCVDEHNRRIRTEIYGEGLPEFVFGERVILTAPIFDAEGAPIAATDDEGVVVSAIAGMHPEYKLYPVIQLQIELDDGPTIVAYVRDTTHPDDVERFATDKEMLAERAREKPWYWPQFHKFVDAFAGVKYAYSITAHRAQGSTYTMAYVDCRDILKNRDSLEALKCFYVACSRPTTKLVLGQLTKQVIG